MQQFNLIASEYSLIPNSNYTILFLDVAIDFVDHYYNVSMIPNNNIHYYPLYRNTLIFKQVRYSSKYMHLNDDYIVKVYACTFLDIKGQTFLVGKVTILINAFRPQGD